MKKSNKPRYFKKNNRIGKSSGKPREKAEGKKKELPSNSRPITDLQKSGGHKLSDKISRIESFLILKSRVLISLMICFLLLMIIIVVGVSLYQNIAAKQNLDREREKITKDIIYWQGIANKYKGYRDAYFQLAVLEYRLGDKVQSEKYLKKVFELDPNFEPGKKLEKLLF